ncbi:MAG: hypothetical protein U5L00_12915 [Desulfovermiculus sp.]|nr:hypothetical protein [Desulfovermiculus sp.]
MFYAQAIWQFFCSQAQKNSFSPAGSKADDTVGGQFESGKEIIIATNFYVCYDLVYLPELS